jgi:predicted Zn-dependent protease
VRWLLRLDGAQTDKTLGLQRLQIVAAKGHYLLPYARLLLAVAALRDNHRDQARTLLRGLAQEFPGNQLYTEELAQLDKPAAEGDER